MNYLNIFIKYSTYNLNEIIENVYNSIYHLMSYLNIYDDIY